MSDLERYLNREPTDGIPPLIDAALMHYQFETIHPFSDGNGRVGRILIPIYLLSKGVLDSPLLFVSPAIDGRKDEYVDRMLAVSKEGDWTGWLLFFLEVVTNAARSATRTIDRLDTLRRSFNERISQAGGSARYATAAEGLFATPVTTVRRIADLLGVSYPAAQNTVRRLADLGILEEVKGSGQPRRYICWAVIEASEHESPA